MELAAEVDPALGGTVAIEPPYRLVPQIEPQVGRGREVAGAEGTFPIAKGLVVAGLARGGFVVVVEPVDRLDVGGVLVLLAERVIEVDVEDLGQAPCLGERQQPGDLMAAEGLPRLRGGPGADPEEVRPVGGIRGVEELPLQGGQGFSLVTDQQAVDEVQEMLGLRSGQVEMQRLEVGFQGRCRLYNAGQHEEPPERMGAYPTPFEFGGTSCDELLYKHIPIERGFSPESSKDPVGLGGLSRAVAGGGGTVRGRRASGLGVRRRAVRPRAFGAGPVLRRRGATASRRPCSRV